MTNRSCRPVRLIGHPRQTGTMNHGDPRRTGRQLIRAATAITALLLGAAALALAVILLTLATGTGTP